MKEIDIGMCFEREIIIGGWMSSAVIAIPGFAFKFALSLFTSGELFLKNI